MWCPHCQADVAAEVSQDGQSLCCTACEGVIRQVFAPSLHPRTQSARELLERWASDDLLNSEITDEPSDLPETPSTIPAVEETQDGPQVEEPPSEKTYRVDAAHPHGLPAPNEQVPRGIHHHGGSRSSSEQNTSHMVRRNDETHGSIHKPHFDVSATLRTAPKTGRGESLWGQLLAYAGVGVLTLGTVLVLWGHFGNIENYSSLGWLVATAGQMLLFLGVITLVSGGMQQTTHAVTERVEMIGEQISRIEQSTQALLHGPHYDHVPSSSSRDVRATTSSEGGDD